MIKILRVFEFVWLGVSALSILKVVELWGTGSDLFYIFAGFAVLGIFMFFFRRRMRRRMEARKQQMEKN